MRATINFKLPEEREEFDAAVAANSLVATIFDIQQVVFRPARKHGYVDAELNKLAEGNEELISKLENLFFEVLRENGTMRFL